MMFEHDSIANIHEGKLVEYLHAVPYWRQWMFGHYGIPENPIYRTEISLTAVPGGLPPQGDIDVMLCGSGRFEETVVYQVKESQGQPISTALQDSSEASGPEGGCQADKPAG